MNDRKLWLARNWASVGANAGHPGVGVVVVWRHHVGIITGRYQYRLAVGLEEPIPSSAPTTPGLPPEQPTLPSLLRKAGYETWLIGKWHLGYLPKYGPLKSGYDHFWGFRSGALERIGKKIDDKVQVSFEATAKPTMPAHP